MRFFPVDIIGIIILPFGMINQTYLTDMIDTFLLKSGMSPTQLGRNALNDRNFVSDVRSKKRSPNLRTVEKLEKYIFGFSNKKTR